jgi:hypothetical protein
VAPQHALDIREGRATLALPYEIRRGVSAPFEASLKDASAQVTGLAVRPRDGQTDWLTLPDMRAERVNVAWPAASATVARIAVDRPRLLTRVEDDGRTNWQQVWTSPPEASPSSTAWAYDVAAVDVTGGAVRLEHSRGGDAPAVELEDVAVHLKSITSKGTTPIVRLDGACAERRHARSIGNRRTIPGRVPPRGRGTRRVCDLRILNSEF